MNLIADSGSTKSVWYSDEQTFFQTEGFNPIVLSEEYIIKGITAQLLPQLSDTEQKGIKWVHFYGAGCAKNEARLKMEAILTQIFPLANIAVHSDMLAAARATCGDKAGLVAILGTGSNACVYDGQNMVKNAVSLGYLLGDEGAGIDIGRELLRNYFYGLFPPDLAAIFAAKYPISEAELIAHLYSQPAPNKYLAQFAAFAVAQQSAPFIQRLISRCFERFIQYHLIPNVAFGGRTVHFVGSIAYLLQDILKQQLAQHNLELGRVLKTPFPALLGYHQQPF